LAKLAKLAASLFWPVLRRAQKQRFLNDSVIFCFLLMRANETGYQMKRELLRPPKSRKLSDAVPGDEHFDDNHDLRPFWRRVNAKAGLPLWEAMLFYGNQVDADIAYSRKLEGFDNPPFYPFEEMSREEQREYNVGSIQLRHARIALEAEILRQLKNGALFATGYSLNTPLDAPAEMISADRWRLLEPDFLASTAKGRGVEISGIRVFKKKARAKAATPKRYSPAELRRWYPTWVKYNVEQGRAPSRDDDLEAAHHKFGNKVHRATLRELRAKLAPAEWIQKGRRKQG
jgi:hypothetical protein